MVARKPMAARKPSGRIRAQQQPQLPAPAEVRRLRDAALAGMRPAEWATMLGRLYLADRISTVQFSVGKRWADLAADYSLACQSPRLPRTAKFDADGSSLLDPESAKGRREAKRHARMIEEYVDGLRVLERAGKPVLCAVRNVCEHDLAPSGWNEVDALRIGLQALAAFWSKPK